MRKKLLFSISIFIILLIITRLVMSSILLNYTLKTLNKIPQYQTRIADCDLHLLQGGYIIKNIRVSKIKNNIPVPYFSADQIYFVLHWRAIFHGKLVGQIIMQNPILNFVIDKQGNNQQLTISSSWQDRVKELYPFRFNQVIINHGEIHLRSFTGKYPFNVYLKNVNAIATNISNILKLQKKLPSAITAQGNTMDGGKVQLSVSFDPLAKQPTFDLDASIKHMNIVAANSLLRSFTSIDVQNGYFSLYLEAAAAKGRITGYAKPYLENLQILNPNENISAPQKLYKAVVAGVAKILENRNTGAVATKISISGNINDPNMSIWSLIINLLKNAFLQALLPQIDHTIKYENININQNR